MPVFGLIRVPKQPRKITLENPKLKGKNLIGSTNQISPRYHQLSHGIQLLGIPHSWPVPSNLCAVHLRLEKAPVTYAGGLRDDETGHHSFTFLARRGARGCGKR